MNWDELKKVWAGQPVAGGAELSGVEGIERQFAVRQRKSARALFWRDVREAVAGVFVAGVFARVGWLMGRDGWPVASGVVLVLGVSGFFVRERIRARRGQLGADAPLLVRIDAEIAEHRRQKRLLLSLGWWYLAPLMAAGAVFVVTVIANAPVPRGPMLLAGAFTAAIFALSGWLVLAMNRRVVRRGIEPRLQELEELRRALTDSP